MAKFLERPALVSAGTLLLDGLYQRGWILPGDDPDAPPPVLIAPGHPRSGGSMSSPPVLEICYGVFALGCATLRFDFRGAGASQGALTADPLTAVEDFHAAAQHLTETVHAASYIAAGYSFGAYIAAMCAQADPVQRLILVAPLMAEYDFSALAAPRCPVLIIAGDNDASCPPDAARKYLDPLGDKGHLALVPGAEHSFQKGLLEISPRIRDFLAPLVSGSAPAQAAPARKKRATRRPARGS